MLIHIDQSFRISLESAEDFKRFSVLIDAHKEDLNKIQNAVQAAGDLVDTDTMWVSESWLRNAPACANDPTWQDGVTAMLGYARKHGWINEANGAIRSHVVWA